MKNLIKVLQISIITLFVLTSCDSDDDTNSSNPTSTDAIADVAETGTWRITSFIDSGEDETSDFNGYNFTFNADGSLVATNGSNTLNGTWSVTNDSSSDDSSSSDDYDFNIFFPVPDDNDFEDLNDDWDIDSVSSTEIALIDISGGNGDTDTLVFTRN